MKANELLHAIKFDKDLIWNDPDLIEGKNYDIALAVPSEDLDDDGTVSLYMEDGSQAEVYVYEIELKQE